MCWKRLCAPKEIGEMGFRSLEEFNLALLAKQGWRLMVDTGSLVSRVYKAKYYSNRDFVNSELGDKPSFIWRNIHGSKDLLELHCRRRIGDGTSTLIWSDCWLMDPPYKV